MLRLFLGLYLILTVGLVVALQTVEHTLDALLAPQMEAASRETFRGTVHALVEQLRGVQGEQRAQRLERLRPAYGLGLDLVRRDQLALSEREYAQLAQGQLVLREQYTQLFSRIDDGDQLLSVKLPREPNFMPVYIGTAYLMLALLLGVVLYFWVRPHWRDLEKLRLAAQRFGDNDLSARVRMPRRSSISDVAGHFDLMAARIEVLIANQREMTNAVSHELRTPIARLNFELDQLRKLPDPASAHQLIGDMYADLGELEDMVSELLTYASLEHGATAMSLQSVEAGSWLDSVIASVTLEAEASGVQIHLAPCQVETLSIEPRFLARAVINLLRNAIRYAKGHIHVSLSCSGGEYRLQVDDDGPGVPVAGRDRIFEPFSRLDSSRDRRTGGFGLGLALVRRVAQSHGGYAQVGDAAAGGASLRMIWPVRGETARTPEKGQKV
ncbi:ATP-binding protein [Pseudomonas mosselii]|uniref:ATP-binding protein n=1 Tax=unclassified Pseudomonas TaxID=196821 RepID=UPI001F352544|nr:MULTISPECIES: ATP-binding protein [unclassified Pseudomonas]MCF1488307.1 ATP-binding protein [Pseudomonas sp. AA27]MCP8631855.1 ATP-binding protein [Pseudomonas sp. DVZ6]MDC0687419.1 ATP-binding protein [Mitsuaria sp. RG]MDD7784865.1 ATP-binding protein [Pseudomonas sp. DVZ24]